MEFEATSGAKVKINHGDFKDVMALKSAIGKEMSHAEFNLEVGKMQGKDFGDIAKLALLVDSSENVQSHVFKCLARCTYNGHKITESTFEDVKAREDYYDIVIACLKVNLAPFFKGLISKLKPFMDNIAGQTENDQK